MARTKKGQARIDSRTSVEQLPTMLNRADLELFLGIRRSAAYKILSSRGVRIGGARRLPKTVLLEMLAQAS